MISSNQSYLHNITQAIENRNFPPAKAMRKIINALPTLDHPVQHFETPRAAAEGVPDAELDRTGRPLRMRREEFLALLSRKGNEYIIQGDGVCFDGSQSPPRLPEEYVALLHYCDAVRYPDL